MGFLLRSAAFISNSNRVVGSECKTGGNAAQAAGKADNRISERRTTQITMLSARRRESELDWDLHVSCALP